jgi:hypothetical protein
MARPGPSRPSRLAPRPGPAQGSARTRARTANVVRMRNHKCGSIATFSARTRARTASRCAACAVTDWWAGRAGVPGRSGTAMHMPGCLRCRCPPCLCLGQQFRSCPAQADSGPGAACPVTLSLIRIRARARACLGPSVLPCPDRPVTSLARDPPLSTWVHPRRVTSPQHSALAECRPAARPRPVPLELFHAPASMHGPPTATQPTPREHIRVTPSGPGPSAARQAAAAAHRRTTLRQPVRHDRP